MKSKQKSRLGLQASISIGRWTPHKIWGDAGDDYLEGGAETLLHQYTTNSIALYADSMPAKCLKGFKNRAKTNQPSCKHRKYKRNQRVAGIEPAQSATEFVVNHASSVHGARV